jgi:hypothetical protein
LQQTFHFRQVPGSHAGRGARRPGRFIAGAGDKLPVRRIEVHARFREGAAGRDGP